MVRHRTMGLCCLVAAFGFGSVGCSSMNNTEKGVLAGGAIGAGLGTAIGAATKNPKTGAVVGTLLGAGVGGIIGNEADQKDEQRTEMRQAAQEQAYDRDQPGRVSEIVDLANAGTPEAQIINHIKNNRMTFSLSAGDLKYLNENRVPARVIETMQTSTKVSQAPVRRGPTVIREEVIVHEPVYITRRPPPPIMIMDPYCRPGLTVRGRW